MAVDGKRKSPRKARLISRVSTRFSLSVENEQADPGRDGRTRLARPNSQARTGTGKMIVPVERHANDPPALDLGGRESERDREACLRPRRK